MNAVIKTSCRSLFRRLAGCILGIVLYAAALSSAGAQTVISITNPSFEAPPLTSSEFSEGATGWTIFNGVSGAGVFSSTLAGTTPPAADGSQMAFANSGIGLVQVLSPTFAPNMLYTFSGYIGHRGNDTNLESTFGAVQIGAYVGGIFYPAASLPATVTSSSTTFTFVSGSSVVTNSDFYGENIAIAVVNQGNALALFDNVHLTVTAIPEPATCVAWAGVVALGVGLGWRRRRLAAGA